MSCSASANSSANLSLTTLPAGYRLLWECLDARLGAHCYSPLHHPAVALSFACCTVFRSRTQSWAYVVSSRLPSFPWLNWSFDGRQMPRPLSLSLQPKHLRRGVSLSSAIVVSSGCFLSLGCFACGAYWARAARHVEPRSFPLHCSDRGPRRCPPDGKT